MRLYYAAVLFAAISLFAGCWADRYVTGTGSEDLPSRTETSQDRQAREEMTAMSDDARRTETPLSEAKPLPQTEQQWQQVLTPEQYYVTRKKGTERAFTGEYWNTKTEGTYRCVCCGEPLFSSDAKFDSGTGWPSFWQPIDEQQIETESDNSWFMRRTEVLCRRCGAHLGHVFEDGPPPTGLRYCINSVALKLDPDSDPAATD